ncbi:MAG: hypothetical protein RLZZ28_2260 [Bacteroidota bacterium]
MPTRHNILFICQDPVSRKLIGDELARNEFHIDFAAELPEGAKIFKHHSYSLILIDLGAETQKALGYCEQIREQSKRIPVIILSDDTAMNTRMEAFQAGVDDYLLKPVYLPELFARMRVFIRRIEHPGTVEKLVVDDMEINLSNKIIVRNGVSINLTSKEFTLLVLLARNKNRIISKQEILEKVWNLGFDTGTNTIEVYISFLRSKIDKPFEKKLIHTKPGFGYYIK